MDKLLVFDTHPVQYRVPIWQAIEALRPGYLTVAYASDSSIKGAMDKDFKVGVAWDVPMLDGYKHIMLYNDNVDPPSFATWNAITGKGVLKTIKSEKPTGIFLTSLNHRYNYVVYFWGLILGIPVWYRCETNDEATQKSGLKFKLRKLYYSIFYKGISKFFYIGELNKKHFIGCGIPEKKLFPALYATVDRLAHLSTSEKMGLRNTQRQKTSIEDGKWVIGFSGKFIFKKNPTIIYKALGHLPKEIKDKVFIYFIGSGELEPELKKEAETAETEWGIKSFFSGFVNQKEIFNHYMALDVLILPSRRMGETWGLVANEAMQCGCSVIVSDAVGCSANFKDFDRFRVFEEGKAEDLAKQITSLSNYNFDCNWAQEMLKPYSIMENAKALL